MFDYIRKLNLSQGDLIAIKRMNGKLLICIFIEEKRYGPGSGRYYTRYACMWNNKILEFERHYIAKVLLRYNQTKII